MSAAHTGRMYYSPGWFVQRLGTLGQFKTRGEALCFTHFGLLCCEWRHCQRKPGMQVQHLQQQLSTTVRDWKHLFFFHVAGAEVLSGGADSWSALLLQLPGPHRVCALGDVQPAHQHLHQGPEGEVSSRKKHRRHVTFSWYWLGNESIPFISHLLQPKLTPVPQLNPVVFVAISVTAAGFIYWAFSQINSTVSGTIYSTPFTPCLVWRGRPTGHSSGSMTTRLPLVTKMWQDTMIMPPLSEVPSVSPWQFSPFSPPQESDWWHLQQWRASSFLVLSHPSTGWRKGDSWRAWPIQMSSSVEMRWDGKQHIRDWKNTDAGFN